MARSTLYILVAVASLTYVAGQNKFCDLPLANLRFPYEKLPYQVITEVLARGPQSGYNQCNSTTENQQSLCQTAVVNNISDFCTFAPPKPNSTIGDSEGEEVCWCTKKGHGCRGIPGGAITGVQVLNAPSYRQIVAFVDQTKIDIAPLDFGGELDPHGQDLCGNPIGGMMYSTFFSADNTLQQVPEWTIFVGGGVIAIKLCDSRLSDPVQLGFCRNTLDRLGIAYNMPNNAQNGTFEVCDSADMGLPGIYVQNGQTLTYAQPAESLGPITSVPYTPTVPASSNCVTYQSSALYTDFASLATPTSGSKPGNGGSGGSGSLTGTASVASSTSASNGAGALAISLFSSLLGVAFSITFLA